MTHLRLESNTHFALRFRSACVTVLAHAVTLQPSNVMIHHTTFHPWHRCSRFARAAAVGGAFAASASSALAQTYTPTHANTSDSMQTRPMIGKPAPAFTVTRWLNRTDTLSPRFGDGHVYLINFTAMWCAPCKLVYPVLDTLQTRFASKGIRVIYATAITGMGEDFMVPVSREEELAKFPQYFAKHHIVAPVAIFDSLHGAWTRYADDNDGTMGVPKLVVIDGHGIVRDVFAGWHTPDTRADDSLAHWHGMDTRERLIADFEQLLQ